MLASPLSLSTLLGCSVLVLAGCGVLSIGGQSPAPVVSRTGAPSDAAVITPQGHRASDKAHDVVLYALGLVETGYRFGGKNPDAGLDCSGMVTYVFNQAADLRLSGSAAELARHGKPIERNALRPGDLVFFNTRNKSYSHVGIYIGDGRFVHAPNSRGKVRTESLREGWFAARFEEARTYFD